MSDSVRPHRRQPTRLPRPWDSPGKNTGVGCHFLLQCMKVNSESEVAQSCPPRSDPMDWSLPGSSVHGIVQARVLEWGAIAFSRNTGDTNSIPGSGRSAGEGIGYPLQYSWASFVAQLVKNPPGFDPWGGKILWRREKLPTPIFWPGEFHGLYRPWGQKESVMTE